MDGSPLLAVGGHVNGVHMHSVDELVDAAFASSNTKSSPFSSHFQFSLDVPAAGARGNASPVATVAAIQSAARRSDPTPAAELAFPLSRRRCCTELHGRIDPHVQEMMQHRGRPSQGRLMRDSASATSNGAIRSDWCSRYAHFGVWQCLLMP